MICGANPSIISNVKVPRWGVQSTPSCSAYLRDQRNGCSAGIILTASHNPGGPDGDFGIKFNGVRGEPVDESFTEAVWEESKRLTSVNIIDSSSCPEIDLAAEPGTKFTVGGCEVEVVDPYEAYVDVLKDFFDFDVIKEFAEDGNRILFDGMHGAGGPFGKRVLGEILGFNDDCFMRCDTRPDFGGCHPDPNLTYGKELVERMGLDGKGMKTGKGEDFCLGAANDGDGDRNLICGNGVFVTPSDSLAIIADRWSDITSVGPLKGVARSMPSSGAVDVVAENKGIKNFITPTGWKFFGNLMDSEVMGGENFSPFLCGEESFGTGSSHIREKDGLWAVLAWVSILSKSPGKTVSDIVASHWGKYGRHYYARYDYEECGSEGANGMMDHLRGMVGKKFEGGGGEGDYKLTSVISFSYTDPVTSETTLNQGMILSFLSPTSSPSRAVFRLSGTGSTGATVRMYLEEYDADNVDGNSQEVLERLGKKAAEIAKLEEFTGRLEPTVIT